MTRFLVIAFACYASFLASCSNNSNNVVLSSLNRSAKMQLLCADLEYTSGNVFEPKGFLPASICTSEADFDTGVNAQLLGAVTQIQTGEVAAHQLHPLRHHQYQPDDPRRHFADRRRAAYGHSNLALRFGLTPTSPASAQRP